MGLKINVVLPVTGVHTAKDQRKADRCNKMIGRGSARSSTRLYALAYGAMANCGQYEPTDWVFVSAEGARSGRLNPDFDELQRAVDARVTFVTDDAANRQRTYNIGERQVTGFLSSRNYQEVEAGVWMPK